MVAIVRLFVVRLSYKTVQINKYIYTERKQSKMFVNREFVEDIRPEDTQFEIKNKKSWPPLPLSQFYIKKCYAYKTIAVWYSLKANVLFVKERFLMP